MRAALRWAGYLACAVLAAAAVWWFTEAFMAGLPAVPPH